MGAFSVEAIVFSDLGGEIYRIAPMTNQSREGLKNNNNGKLADPKTNKAKIRNNRDNPKEPKTVNSKSKDGEIYLIDKLNDFFANYFKKEKLDAMKKPEAKAEHLRIELVGPRGTCEDCQAALQQWLHNDLQGKANKAGIGQKVSFSLADRYLPEDKRDKPGGGSYKPDARTEARNMGSMYGHPDAKHKPDGINAVKGQIKKADGTKEFDTEHDRLKYKSKPPQRVEGVTGASNQVKPSEVKHGEKIEEVTGASNQVKPSEVKHGEKIEEVTGASNQVKPRDVKQDDEGFTTVSHKTGKKKSK